MTGKLFGYDIPLDKGNGCTEMEIEHIADNFPFKKLKPWIESGIKFNKRKIQPDSNLVGFQ